MIDEALDRCDRRVILVDGFNVLHAVLLGSEREGWWRREVRERLLERLGLWRESGDQIWVAFDGACPSWSVWAEPVAQMLGVPAGGPLLHCVFVESADDWIVRRARRAPDPARTIVVSADRKVVGRARGAGCEIWTPWAFMARCPSRKGGAERVEPLATTREDPPPAVA